jgi:multiple antibiotic resistance protein
MLQHRLAEFVTLIVILDPAGVLPIFVALTADCAPAQRRRVALLAIFVSFWVLTAFIVGGEILLQLMGIPLRSFQIAGGIVLFLYGVGMVLGEVKDTPAPATSDAIMSLAIYPIAIPGIAGPGSILAVVLLTDNTRFSIPEQFGTLVVLAAALATILAILLFANPISRLVGKGGANVLKRIMGLVLTAVAVNMVLSALSDWLGLPKL